jgi:hypothetical protein
MIYQFFKLIVQLSLRAYFKRIDVVGRAYLEEGRAVYVSNHPGAMIDPIIVAMHVRKPFHFITGAEWFGKGIKRWVFEDQFHMVPVHRPWLKKDKEAAQLSNDDMFKACYKSLERNDRIMIYPEASSMTVPWIRELKTGAARIKLGGDAYLKEQGDEVNEIKVIPIGINYENPHRFQTRATIVVGQPIDFSDIDTSDEAGVVGAMTQRIKEGMQSCVLHMEEEQYYPVIKRVIKLMESVVIKDLGIAPDKPEASFKARKEIIRAVEYYKRTGNRAFEELEGDIQSYIQRFEREGFRRFNPFEETRGKVVLNLLLVVLTFPFFLIGFVLNVMPYFFSRAIFRSLLLEKVTGEHKQGDFNPAFAGSLAYAVGVGMYLVWYIGLAIVSSMLYTWWVSIPLVWFIAYQTGKVALLYMRWLKRLRDVWHWKAMGADARKEILQERHRILRQLQVFKLKYLKQV